MKKTKIVSIAIGALFYLGSMSILNNVFAHDHGERSPMKMLFKNLDLTDDQRQEVRSIMLSTLKEGRSLRSEMREESLGALDDLKKGTHEQLSVVLSEEQMTQFNKNSERMDQRRAKMLDKKMKGHDKRRKHKKDKKRNKNKEHKERH